MDSIERYFIERIDTYLKVLTKFQMDEEKYGNTINIPACKSTLHDAKVYMKLLDKYQIMKSRLHVMRIIMIDKN